MEKRVFGKTGMEVSVLGFGGAEIGFAGTPAETVAQVLNAALDAGLNVLDTAECYGSGEGRANSEELIGQTVSHRRGDFFLFSKCGHRSGFEEPDWDAGMLEKSIERSLKRLKTDHLDLMQLHTCGEDILRQGDVIAVLQKAQAAGKTRFLGYSGDSRAALYAVECGAFDTLQTSVNVADQECIALTLPKAQAANLGVIAKRPLANVAWRHADEESARDRYEYAYWSRLQKLQYPFLQSHGNPAEDAVGIALRFTLSVPGVHTAIVGTTRPNRWKDNAALLKAGPLSAQDFDAIRARWHEAAEPDWTGQG